MLKCASILTVVYIHSISTSLFVTNFSGNLCSDFTRFAVPGLFFAAGFLFNISAVSTSQIIRKKLIRILPPYILISLGIQFLNLPGLSYRLEDLGAKQLLYNLMFGNTVGIYYFIFVLFYLYSFSLFLRLISRNSVFVIWGLSLLLLLLFVKILILEGYSFFALLRHPFFHSFSYLSGYVYCLYYRNIRAFLKNHIITFMFILSLLDTTLIAITRVNGKSFSSYPIITQLHIYIFICLLIIVGINSTKFTSIIRLLSNYSYGIFLLHFPIVRGCQLFYPEIATDYSFSYAFISWFAGVSISILLILVIRKVAGSYAKYIVGC